MTVFPRWKVYATHQRRIETGCIPTGYEMILRAADAKGVDFGSFQDDFDLDVSIGRGQSVPLNNFESVAEEIRKKYPWVEFASKSFATGNEKLIFIDESLSKNQPILISLAQAPFGRPGWHIMPIVDANDKEYLLLQHVREDGSCLTDWLSKAYVASIHDRFSGGKEVAYLQKLSQPH